MKRCGIVLIIAAFIAAAYFYRNGTGWWQKRVERFTEGAVLWENTAHMEDAEYKKKAAGAEKEADRQLQGSLVMAGSTAMENFAGSLAESFMLRYPNVTVTVEFTGSSVGIEAVLCGSADIGNSSRVLSKDEKERGAVENIVAFDAIAVITDASNPVMSLTMEQLADIYTGKVRNWREVGGEDQAVIVVGREAGSGTRCAFEKLLKIEDRCAYANEVDSTGAVMARAATIPGTIGYVSLDVLDGTVGVIAIDGIEPTERSVGSGKYPLRHPFVMVTDGGISEQDIIVQEFFAYLKTPEGQEVIRSLGFAIPD